MEDTSKSLTSCFDFVEFRFAQNRACEFGGANDTLYGTDVIVVQRIMCC